MRNSVELLLGVAPREVVVRLREADLGEAVQDVRAGERLGEEDRLRVGRLDLADQPLPERRTAWCAGCRPGRSATPCVDPEVDDRLELVPQRPPAGRSRSRTGRCPGTSSAGSRRTGWSRPGAAGTTPGAPSRTGGPGAHWKAMSSAISSPCSAAAPTRCRKSSSVPSSGWIAVWPPSAAPIAQGLPGSSGPATVRVVGALAEAPADRVDRRQVEDVEAHRRDRRGAAPRRRRTCRGAPAPVAAERGNSSYHAPKRARSRSTTTASSGGEARCEAALRVTVHEVGELARRGRRPGPCPATADRRGKGEETRRVGPGRPRGRSLDEAGADEEVRGDILAGGEALRQVARPGGEVVDPGDDGVAVAADLLDRERRPPAVVDERRHRCLGPVLVDLAAMEEDDGDHVVPVGVGDGLDLHRVADDALDRERAAVDAGGDAVDDDAAAPVARAHRCSSEIVQRDCRSARTVSRRRPIGTGPSSPGRWRPS